MPRRWPPEDRVYWSRDPQFIQVTRDLFTRSKAGDLRYTKESLPYFVASYFMLIRPQGTVRSRPSDGGNRISSDEIRFRGFWRSSIRTRANDSRIKPRYVQVKQRVLREITVRCFFKRLRFVSFFFSRVASPFVYSIFSARMKEPVGLYMVNLAFLGGHVFTFERDRLPITLSKNRQRIDQRSRYNIFFLLIRWTLHESVNVSN